MELSDLIIWENNFQPPLISNEVFRNECGRELLPCHIADSFLSVL
jgi:hypothetical protein